MKSSTLTFLGTGSAFTTDPNNFQTNLLAVGATGRRLLIDCGGDARRALAVHGLSASDVDGVYISHLHADHVGGLEWLGFATYFAPGVERPALFIVDEIADALWSNVLSGGMRHISGQEANASTYFDLRPQARNATFEWDGISATLVPTTHILGSSATVQSYGLLLRGPRQTIYLTTDTVCTVRPEVEIADVILHDCELTAAPTNVHAPYAQLLRELPPSVRAKTWLYGCDPGPLPNAERDGFCGFNRPGQSFEL